MTTLSELLSNVLVKNTTNMIVDYLTDPPVLPFINELILKTIYLRLNDTIVCYSNYYIIMGDKFGRRLKIFRSGAEWEVRVDYTIM